MLGIRNTHPGMELMAHSFPQPNAVFMNFVDFALL
jgi:hypothetical protein